MKETECDVTYAYPYLLGVAANFRKSQIPFLGPTGRAAHYFDRGHMLSREAA